MKAKVVSETVEMNTSSNKACLTDIITDDEHGKLLEACGGGALGIRNQAMLSLLYSSGLRRSELCALNVGDVDFNTHQVHVRNGKGGTNGKSVFCSITKVLLLRWLDKRRELGIKPRGPLFCQTSKSKGAAIHPSYIYNRLQALARKANIGKRIHPHMYRRSTATKLINTGATLDRVMSQLRHRSSASTHTYIRAAATNSLMPDVERAFGGGDHVNRSILRQLEESR